jgi:HAE1 family hydrophobic/amphiphilic exporter-1
MALTRWAIRWPAFTGFAFALIALAGILSAPSLKVQRIPDVIIPTVGVRAAYPGASPAEVEKLVVKPIEEQLDGMQNLERLSATVQNGTVTILAEFALDTDVRAEVGDVQRRVDTARAYMPQDLVPPEVYDDTSRAVLLEAIGSAGLSRARLEDIVTNQVVPKLRSLRGSDIEERSTLRREIHVDVDVARLQSVGATLGDVLAGIASNSAEQPGGYFDSPLEELNVRLSANVTSPSDLADIPVSIAAPSGAAAQPPAFRVGDVATVEDGFAEGRRQVLLDGAPAIELLVGRTQDGDTLKITDGARRILAEFARAYPQLRFQEISTSSDATRASVNNVVRSLVESIVVTALAMLVFLRSWRDGLIVSLAIPTSVLATLLVMRWLNLTVDLVSMMALGLTIGILVDDSIVVLENIVRHRRAGESPVDAALNGRDEIAKAAVAITMVDVVVFVPIVLIGGEIGKYIHEFGIVVVVATLFSLLVSFTLTPLLAARWPAPARPSAPRPNRFERVYSERVLPWAFRHGALVAGACAAAVAAAAALLVNGAIEQEFIPFAAPQTIHGSLRYPVGTPLGVVEGGLARVQRRISALPGVAAVLTSAGALPGSEVDTLRGNLGSFTIVPAGEGERGALIAAAKRLGYLVPGAQYLIGGGGDDHRIAFALAGPDAELDRAVSGLERLLRAQPALTDVRGSMQADSPQLEVAVDQRKARVVGIAPADALTAARIATGGALATRVRLPAGLVDVRVQVPPAERNPRTLRRVTVRAADGTLVPLGAVARIARGAEATTIARLARERVIEVTANLAPGAGVSLGTAVAPVLRAIETPGVLPAGVHAIPEGEVDLFTRVLGDMRGAMLAAVALVFMLMVVLYGSVREPLVILTSLPLALVGALGGLALRHQTLNLFSMMALLMLFGLVAKNAILLVDKAKDNVRRGAAPRAAMQAAAAVRLRPIAMTTSAMVVGMLPLSLGWGAGLADRSPMGTVLIGGLLSSLILTLVLVPIVYVWALERRTAPEIGANSAVRADRVRAGAIVALDDLPR